MVREQCSFCGSFRDVEYGQEFPAHPDTRHYPRFAWCAGGTTANAIVAVEAPTAYAIRMSCGY